MARSNHSHLAAQVAALRGLVEARLGNSAGPIYLRSGDPVPEGVDVARVVFISRTFVEPPLRVEDELSVQQEPIFNDDSRQRQERRQALEYPPMGIA